MFSVSCDAEHLPEHFVLDQSAFRLHVSLMNFCCWRATTSLTAEGLSKSNPIPSTSEKPLLSHGWCFGTTTGNRSRGPNQQWAPIRVPAVSLYWCQKWDNQWWSYTTSLDILSEIRQNEKEQREKENTEMQETQAVTLAFPHRWRELNDYTSLITEFALSYSGSHFYTYHKLFSAECSVSDPSGTSAHQCRNPIRSRFQPVKIHKLSPMPRHLFR